MPLKPSPRRSALSSCPKFRPWVKERNRSVVDPLSALQRVSETVWGAHDAAPSRTRAAAGDPWPCATWSEVTRPCGSALSLFWRMLSLTVDVFWWMLSLTVDSIPNFRSHFFTSVVDDKDCVGTERGTGIIIERTEHRDSGLSYELSGSLFLSLY